MLQPTCFDATSALFVGIVPFGVVQLNVDLKVEKGEVEDRRVGLSEASLFFRLSARFNAKSFLSSLSNFDFELGTGGIFRNSFLDADLVGMLLVFDNFGGGGGGGGDISDALLPLIVKVGSGVLPNLDLPRETDLSRGAANLFLTIGPPLVVDVVDLGELKLVIIRGGLLKALPAEDLGALVSCCGVGIGVTAVVDMGVLASLE